MNPSALVLTPAMVAALLQQAVAHYQAGRLAQAESLAQQLVAAAPQHAEVLNFCGAIHYQAGRAAQAAAYLRRAVAAAPSNASFHANLGSVLQALGQAGAAIVSYQQAVLVQPDYADAHLRLAALCVSQHLWGVAKASLQQVLAQQPHNAVAHYQLGEVALAQHQQAEAVAFFRQAIALDAQYADAHCALAWALLQAIKTPEIAPENAHQHAAEAEHHLAQVRALNPQYAEQCWQQGNQHAVQGRLDDALVGYQKALALTPNFLSAYCNQGVVLLQQGKPAEAIAQYRQALAINPAYAAAHSNILLTLQYSSEHSAADIFAAHLGFADQFEAPLKPQWQPHENAPDLKRKLKIGYVSADFYSHSVAFFIQPILQCHQKSAFEIYGYYNNTLTDAVTASLKACCDHWVCVAEMSDAQMAEKIRADGIDILVDLSGHTGSNRLVAFAHKPAPVQATWLGYPGTTGLAAMDYRLTDAHLDPVGTTDAFHTETLVRLPSSAAFTPAAHSPAVNPLPALQAGYVTFACLNNLAKINVKSVQLWARILVALPRAKLMLGNVQNTATQQRLLALFAQEGVAAEQLIMQPTRPLAEFLALHQQIDVALDPYPYGGGTTSSHALWMGVPVITLAGATTASRHGAALLGGVGLHEFIAHTEDAYVACALATAHDLTRLNTLRLELRERIAAHTERSPEALTRSLETAYREMWASWCRERQQ